MPYVGCGDKAFIQELRKAILEDTRAICFIASDFVTSYKSKDTEKVESLLSPASSFDKTIDSLRISVRRIFWAQIQFRVKFQIKTTI